jgi:ketosteroid isomerase-like protein
MALINSAVASFNKGDGKAWEALCAPSAPVVSNIAPYTFSSCADWWNANTAYVTKNGVSGERATLETAWHIIVTGDRAYAAIPTDLTYKQKGKTVKSSGILTIALQKTGGGWLMTGWSWAAH